MLYGVHYEAGRQFSVAAPLFQAKYLVKKPQVKSWPGLAFVGGAFAPRAGMGPFAGQVSNMFAYAAVTHSFAEGDSVLVHGNVGITNSPAGRKATLGLGSQVRVSGGFHVVTEVFSGDPYTASPGVAFQGGFRHFISEYIQVDATVGSGMAGDPRLPLWATVGVRLVTPPLGRKVFEKIRLRR